MLVKTFIIYFFVSIGVAILVGTQFLEKGHLALVKATGNEKLAKALTQLITINFFLLTIGIILFMASIGDQPTTLNDSFDYLYNRIGFAFVVIAFFNILSIRRISTLQTEIRKEQQLEHHYKSSQ